jgi:hypothetical protein
MPYRAVMPVRAYLLRSTDHPDFRSCAASFEFVEGEGMTVVCEGFRRAFGQSEFKRCCVRGFTVAVDDGSTLIVGAPEMICVREWYDNLP